MGWPKAVCLLLSDTHKSDACRVIFSWIDNKMAPGPFPLVSLVHSNSHVIHY